MAFDRKTDVMDCQVHSAPVAAVEFREAESGILLFSRSNHPRS
jgi:hypothetical protein